MGLRKGHTQTALLKAAGNPGEANSALQIAFSSSLDSDYLLQNCGHCAERVPQQRRYVVKCLSAVRQLLQCSLPPAATCKIKDALVDDFAKLLLS